MTLYLVTHYRCAIFTTKAALILGRRSKEQKLRNFGDHNETFLN